MKLSLVNIHELAMNQIKTYQVHNNLSKWWILTINHALNNETNQVHNISSQFMKQSLVNFHEPWTELRLIKFIIIHQIHKTLSLTFINKL